MGRPNTDALLAAGTYRDRHGHPREKRHNTRIDFYNCKNFSVFCGMQYMPKPGLCGNCYRRQRYRSRGEHNSVSHRSTYHLSCSRGNSVPNSRNSIYPSIRFSGTLYADGHYRYVSWQRFLWEKCEGPIPDGYRVVNVSDRIWPSIVDLMLVPEGETSTRHVVGRLMERDIREGS